MLYLYDLIIYRPLLNLLVFLYNTVALHNLGLAIIFVTVLIRLVLFPIFHKSVRHQMVMVKLQPKLKKIQEDHKHDKEKQAQAIMALYKEHGVNPLSGFLLLLIQVPILIALYQIFLKSLEPNSLTGLYGFIKTPIVLDASFLGLINLSQGSIIMVVLAAVAQYFQARLSVPKTPRGEVPSQAERLGHQMAFIGPLLTILIFYGRPSAIALYWAVTSLFSIIQQLIINKQFNKDGLGNINQKNY